MKDPESPNSCFRDFEDRFKNGGLAAYQAEEHELQGLDPDAWECLKRKALHVRWDNKCGRGQHQLLELFNEARAYNFLRETGCSAIHFIPESKTKGEKTPDLEGVLESGKVICEVKTIEPSQDEALRRGRGNYLHPGPLKLEQEFFKKLTKTLISAKEQIELYDAV